MPIFLRLARLHRTPQRPAWSEPYFNWPRVILRLDKMSCGAVVDLSLLNARSIILQIHKPVVIGCQFRKQKKRRHESLKKSRMEQYQITSGHNCLAQLHLFSGESRDQLRKSSEQSPERKKQHRAVLAARPNTLVAKCS